ncbi:MAG: hypothetical protein M1834_005244 [Cirrosporium novae-zelandiae]|nr:MAG: hypothetical protein M1834_005244 [Cirrosporium novae-zelandiae]
MSSGIKSPSPCSKKNKRVLRAVLFSENDKSRSSAPGSEYVPERPSAAEFLTKWGSESEFAFSIYGSKYKRQSATFRRVDRKSMSRCRSKGKHLGVSKKGIAKASTCKLACRASLNAKRPDTGALGNNKDRESEKVKQLPRLSTDSLKAVRVLGIHFKDNEERYPASTPPSKLQQVNPSYYLSTRSILI